MERAKEQASKRCARFVPPRMHSITVSSPDYEAKCGGLPPPTAGLTDTVSVNAHDAAASSGASPEALDPKQTPPLRKDGAGAARLVHWTTTVPPNVGKRHAPPEQAVFDIRLARSIADSAWALFGTLLAYKATWYGAELTVADRFYPSTRRCGATRSAKRST